MRIQVAIGLLGLILQTAFAQPSQAAMPTLEIKTDEQTFVGRREAHDQNVCWLMENCGQLQRIPFTEVEAFRQISPAFQPISAAELRDKLTRELQNSLEIKGTTHYLVAAAPGRAEKYGELLEQVYREAHLYFSTRGFSLQAPEFPLVAIIYPTQQQFLEAAQRDQVTETRGLKGYYHTRTNRILAFELPEPSAESLKRISQKPARSSLLQPSHIEDLQGTLIHEATHQFAFNTGLHSRLGDTPRWVVEGLALAFEQPQSRQAVRSESVKQRINRERFVWFGNYREARRNPQNWNDFLSSESPFRTAPLDSYSEAWALTFYLMETRSSQYVQYLKSLSSRDPLQVYTSDERLADFQTAFGSDLKLLEADYLRYWQRFP